MSIRTSLIISHENIKARTYDLKWRTGGMKKDFMFLDGEAVKDFSTLRTFFSLPCIYTQHDLVPYMSFQQRLFLLNNGFQFA